MSPLLIPEPPLWHSLNRATGFWSKAAGSWTMTSPSMLISTWRMASLSKSPLASSALNSQLSFAVVYSKSRDLFCLQFPQSHRGAFSVAFNVIVCPIDFSLKACINPKKSVFSWMCAITSNSACRSVISANPRQWSEQSDDVSMVMRLKGLTFVDQIEWPEEIKIKQNIYAPLENYSAVRLIVGTLRAPLRSSSLN